MPLQNGTAPSVVWLTENWGLPYGLIGRLCSVPIQEDLACSWAAVYLWMAVRSLWTGRSSSSFLLGSTYLVNLSSLCLHPWYGLPLPWAFKVWHKKRSLKVGVSMHRRRPTENFLFSCIVFKVFCPFLQDISYSCSAFWGASIFLIGCYYCTWSECSPGVVEKVGTSLTQTSCTQL